MVSERPGPHDVAQIGTPSQLADPFDEPRRRARGRRGRIGRRRRPASRPAPRRSARPRPGRRRRAASRPASRRPAGSRRRASRAASPARTSSLVSASPSMPGRAHREPQRRKVQPATAARPAGDRAELVAALAQAGRRSRRRARSETDRRRRAWRSPWRSPARCRSWSGRCPAPAHAPPAVVDDDVTNGYVPWSMSSSTPCAPSNITLSPRDDRVVHELATRRRRTGEARPRARGSAAAISSASGRGAAQRGQQRRQRLDLARELAAETLGAEQIADAHAGARGLALVGRADPLAGGADGVAPGRSSRSRSISRWYGIVRCARAATTRSSCRARKPCAAKASGSRRPAPSDRRPCPRPARR